MEQLTGPEHWADLYLTDDVDIQLRTDGAASKIFISIAIGFTSLILIVPPIWILVASITGLIAGNAVNVRGIVLSLVFIAIVAGLFAFTFFYIRRTRNRIVRRLTQYGVVTRNGVLYLWTDLSKIEFRPMARSQGPYRSIEDAMHEVLVDGASTATCRLVFSEGFAAVPPIIRNYSQIFHLIHSIPVKHEWKWH